MQRRNNNGKNDGAHLAVVNANYRERETVVPPHLAQVDWINHEEQTALSSLAELQADLKPLAKKVSASRVHKARVSLRRWASIWHVLRKDGWESGKFSRNTGRTLRKLQKLLGELRDIDVNIEQGEKLGCTTDLLEEWAEQRKKHQRRLEEFIDKHDLNKLTKKLEKYLSKRAQKIRDSLPLAKVELCAFDHTELYLLKQESIAHEQADTARTPDEYHQLRLTIKRWRYLLTEFFGLTNLELVRAQQILGQMHDLDRLTPMLVHDEKQQKALEKLKAKRKELLRQIDEMRTRLPYGLRPAITSLKSTSAASPRR